MIARRSNVPPSNQSPTFVLYLTSGHARSLLSRFRLCVHRRRYRRTRRVAITTAVDHWLRFGGSTDQSVYSGPEIEDAATLELLAEIGVILLMFSVGLEFSLKDLLRSKWVAVVGGFSGTRTL